MQWIDQYSRNSERYRIKASGPHGARRLARVNSYGDVLRNYERHPEAKCAGADGRPCGKQTTGLLQRRHIAIDGFDYIGKESNKLEQVEEGGIPAESDVYTIYADPRRDERHTLLLVLRRIPLPELEHDSKLDRRTLQRIRSGKQRPHAANMKMLRALALKHRAAPGS